VQIEGVESIRIMLGIHYFFTEMLLHIILKELTAEQGHHMIHSGHPRTN